MIDTGAIKQRLNRHKKMVEDCEALRIELNFARQKYGDIRSSGLSSTGKGSGPNTDKVANRVIVKMQLEERVNKKQEDITRDEAELEPLLDCLKPAERLLISLRYFYGSGWREVCKGMYGGREDYELEMVTYMNRVFKMHGRALLALAAVYKG